MNRRTFDALMTVAGVVIAAVFLVVGGLALWGHQFANDNVKSQLVAQKIYFPQKGSEELADSKIGPYLNKYAGQQMTNGAQAKAYADHFIAVHLTAIGKGQTYSQISAKALQQPKNEALAAQANTMFKGESLRSMLLNAYAFWKMGQIALYAAFAAFAGAALMLLLAVLGFVHLRRTSPAAEVLPKIAGHHTATAATA
jgi:hypothetical protein